MTDRQALWVEMMEEVEDLLLSAKKMDYTGIEKLLEAIREMRISLAEELGE